MMANQQRNHPSAILWQSCPCFSFSVSSQDTDLESCFILYHDIECLNKWQFTVQIVPQLPIAINLPNVVELKLIDTLYRIIKTR